MYERGCILLARARCGAALSRNETGTISAPVILRCAEIAPPPPPPPSRRTFRVFHKARHDYP